MKENTWGVIAAVFTVAILYMLVRPGAPAVAAVQGLGASLENVISLAVNGPGNSPIPT
jgi:hypothetical protein